MNCENFEMNAEAETVIKTLDRAIFVDAAPGCGKTETLAQKIIYLVKTESIRHPFRILVLTYSKAAVRELRARLRGKGFTAWYLIFLSTIHGFCNYILTSYGRYIGIHEDFEIFADKETVDFSRSIIESIGSKKSSGIIPLTQDPLYTQFQQYQQYLEKENLLDYADLIIKAVKLLENPYVKGIITDTFPFLIVDEFQDTSLSQLEIIKVLAKRARNCTFAGDRNQAIYEWRDAHPENIDAIIRYTKAKIIRLVKNYRCEANGQYKYTEYSKMVFSSERDEITYLIREISNLIQNGYSDFKEDIAVIARVKSRLESIANALKSAGIERTYEGDYYFPDTEFIEYILKALRLASNLQNTGYCSDLLSFFYETNTLLLSDDDDPAMFIYRYCEAVRSVLHGSSGHIRVTDLDKLVDLSRIRELIAVNSSTKRQLDRNIKDLAELLTYLQKTYITLISESNLNLLLGKNAIQITSIHGCKGRQFDYVFLLGLEAGLFPDRRANTSKKVDEEERLFKVATSRQRKKVFLCRISTKPVSIFWDIIRSYKDFEAWMEKRIDIKEGG